MPTLRSGGFLFGSADAAALDYAVAALPCGDCGAVGPHGHRVRRANGVSVLCQRCHHADEDLPDMLHLPPPVQRPDR